MCGMVAASSTMWCKKLFNGCQGSSSSKLFNVLAMWCKKVLNAWQGSTAASSSILWQGSSVVVAPSSSIVWQGRSSKARRQKKGDSQVKGNSALAPIFLHAHLHIKSSWPEHKVPVRMLCHHFGIFSVLYFNLRYCLEDLGVVLEINKDSIGYIRMNSHAHVPVHFEMPRLFVHTTHKAITHVSILWARNNRHCAYHVCFFLTWFHRSRSLHNNLWEILCVFARAIGILWLVLTAVASVTSSASEFRRT